MSVTDAVNTSGALAYQYPNWNTLLGPTGGDPPGSTDTFEDCHATLVVQSASGSRLDFAELKYLLSGSLTNRSQPADFTRMVAVTLPDGPETRIHLGDYVTEEEKVEQGSEMLTGQSQLRPYHFGSPVKGMLVKDPISDADVEIPYPLQFNPTIDDRTRPNMSANTRSDGDSRLWLHGEAAWTVKSQEYHDDDTPEEWTLKEAVKACCELLNLDEDHIRNPSTESLNKIDFGDYFRGITIAIGTYLPDILDTLLIPHGFNWYVDYDTATDKPIITIFKIGEGDQKELYFQAPGEALNLQWSNVNQYQINRSIGDSFNQVRILGDFKKYEMTFQLWPGWKEEHDDLESAELAKSADTFAEYENVWRLWVANEDGQLGDGELRWSETMNVPDLSFISDPFVPRRRQIEEPLTYAGGGEGDSEERRPFWIEYTTGGTNGTYEPIPDNWSVKLLPDQIGIYFDGEEPPSELITAAEGARLRITGVVAMDERIEGLAEKQSSAVNGRTIELVLDEPQKFQYRQRLEDGSDWESVLFESQNSADTRDDTTAIQDFAEDLRDKNQHADMECEFRLPGWHLEYKIGDLLTNILGREVSLDGASTTASQSKYVQVVERRFEGGETAPFTVLIVDRGTAVQDKKPPVTLLNPLFT